MKNKSNAVVGVIIGNRDFFPDKLVATARAEIIELFQQLDITPIMLIDTDSKLGGVIKLSAPVVLSMLNLAASAPPARL